MRPAVRTSLIAITALAALAFASSASAAVVYDNIATPQASNVASLGYEATSTSEWGGQVQLAGTARKDPKVTVLMSSWGCQSGGGATCATKPGATFTLPITLKLYAVNPDQSVGAAIATRTETFAIPFRPSVDPTCPGGTAWRDKAGVCFNGFATPITFSLSGEGITLPSNVIATIAYNTSHHGYSPRGTQPCAANCGYDSLNVGAETAGPTVGSIPAALINDTYWATTFAGFYCDGGVGGTGTLRRDECTPATGWAPNQPSFEISASETEGEAGPIGPAGPTGTAGANGSNGTNGATGADGKSASAASPVALKRKMAITFPDAAVTTNGANAKVQVHCNGSTLQRCIGTLTLKSQGTVQRAAYSVLKGKTVTVNVPLDAGLVEKLSADGAGTVVRAVARTEQDAGRPFRTSRKLHIG
jgi:hypothetical protein